MSAAAPRRNVKSLRLRPGGAIRLRLTRLVSPACRRLSSCPLNPTHRPRCVPSSGAASHAHLGATWRTLRHSGVLRARASACYVHLARPDAAIRGVPTARSPPAISHGLHGCFRPPGPRRWSCWATSSAPLGRVVALASVTRWRLQPIPWTWWWSANHDARSGDPPPGLGFRVVQSLMPTAVHACTIANPRPVRTCGHIPPASCLPGGPANRAAPCFVRGAGARCAGVGHLTGCAIAPVNVGGSWSLPDRNVPPRLKPRGRGDRSEPRSLPTCGFWRGPCTNFCTVITRYSPAQRPQRPVFLRFREGPLWRIALAPDANPYAWCQPALRTRCSRFKPGGGSTVACDIGLSPIADPRQARKPHRLAMARTHSAGQDIAAGGRPFRRRRHP